MGQFAHGAGVDAGVLAHVERVQVKAERLNLSQQRIEPTPSDPFARMRREARAHERQISGELACARVSVRLRRHVNRSAQPVQHEDEKAPVHFIRRACFHLLFDGRETGGVSGERVLQFR